jgi:hypothetical protein
MTVQDDVRRLSQMDSIYLGYNTQGMFSLATSWHKGRLQQANDGAWTFRSSGSDGSVVGFQLGQISADWTSNESPSQGITVSFQIYTVTQVQTQPTPTPVQIFLATVFLQQQLPFELTN